MLPEIVLIGVFWGVISGFPAYPNASMLKYPNKTYEQPRFPLNFEVEGYSTRFYYAGDLNLADSVLT